MSSLRCQQPTEFGDPAADPASFRRCLGQFATGVTVITASSTDSLVGMTANSFSSVSLDPPLVLWSAKRGSPSYPAFESASHFAINILSDDQIHLSKHFGKSGPDKFDEVAWAPGAGGAPLLHGALASFECRRVASYPGGDHTIFLGQVERFTRHDRSALLFVQGRYGIAADHPEAATQQSPHQDIAAGPMNEFLTALLYRAHGSLSDALEEGRRAEGLSLLQTRLMSAIETLPNRSLEDLLPHLFLGANAAQGTVHELEAMGIVAVSNEGLLTLTARGIDRSRALLARARDIEARNIADLPATDVAACRRVLNRLISRGDDQPLSMGSARQAV